jgi:hypothetical protein
MKFFIGTAFLKWNDLDQTGASVSSVPVPFTNLPKITLLYASFTQKSSFCTSISTSNQTTTNLAFCSYKNSKKADYNWTRILLLHLRTDRSESQQLRIVAIYPRSVLFLEPVGGLSLIVHELSAFVLCWPVCCRRWFVVRRLCAIWKNNWLRFDIWLDFWFFGGIFVGFGVSFEIWYSRCGTVRAGKYFCYSRLPI